MSVHDIPSVVALHARIAELEQQVAEMQPLVDAVGKLQGQMNERRELFGIAGTETGEMYASLSSLNFDHGFKAHAPSLAAALIALAAAVAQIEGERDD